MCIGPSGSDENSLQHYKRELESSYRDEAATHTTPIPWLVPHTPKYVELAMTREKTYEEENWMMYQ